MIDRRLFVAGLVALRDRLETLKRSQLIAVLGLDRSMK